MLPKVPMAANKCDERKWWESLVNPFGMPLIDYTCTSHWT
ncbi:hypothetical protein J010_06716 [Cryptococcus neoformans]|nr:hypothetical protein C353_06724 [Cryptococcus neoformans var. grubii AD1-83a]OWZ60864.1 hypothetical protein AYX15_06886 [Cryptococcus neoformans var. grubii]OXH01334.1 hypothetical protein C369_06843 [Cryptococcus neoformans var. grubii A5-35-17]OXH02612.1 hypothetical protein C370_06903 [Cryptococcus neoformans var. grubii A1-35-8]OXH00498.1 hypothetical protein J010_06716 [Cryptococcus neoformans var. grubii]